MAYEIPKTIQVGNSIRDVDASAWIYCLENGLDYVSFMR